MVWHIRALVGKTIERYQMEEDGTALTPAGEGTPFEKPGTEEIGRAGELRFSLVGDGPSFDVKVEEPGVGTLRIAGVHATTKHFGHLPNLDAAAIITGDAGTDVSRRIVLFGLEQIRAALAEGVETLHEDKLDHFRIQGAVNGIDMAAPSLSFWPVADSPEVAMTWNIPRANPPKGTLLVLNFLNYSPGVRFSTLAPSFTKAIELESFWLSELLVDRDLKGNLVATAAGVGRKRRDFCLSLRRLVTTTPDADLRRTVAEFPFKEHLMENLKLRDNDGIKALALLPGDRGIVVALEDMMKRRALHRVHFKEGGFTHEPVSGPEKSRRFWLDAEPPPPPAEAEADAPEDAPDDEEGRATARPGGTAVSLGTHPADSDVWAQVYVVGDGAGAGFNWWISQAEGGGDVEYTLHLEASREVAVRYLLFEG